MIECKITQKKFWPLSHIKEVHLTSVAEISIHPYQTNKLICDNAEFDKRFHHQCHPLIAYLIRRGLAIHHTDSINNGIWIQWGI